MRSRASDFRAPREALAPAACHALDRRAVLRGLASGLAAATFGGAGCLARTPDLTMLAARAERARASTEPAKAVVDSGAAASSAPLRGLTSCWRARRGLFNTHLAPDKSAPTAAGRAGATISLTKTRSASARHSPRRTATAAAPAAGRPTRFTRRARRSGRPSSMASDRSPHRWRQLCALPSTSGWCGRRRPPPQRIRRSTGSAADGSAGRRCSGTARAQRQTRASSRARAGIGPQRASRARHGCSSRRADGQHAPGEAKGGICRGVLTACRTFEDPTSLYDVQRFWAHPTS